MYNYVWDSETGGYLLDTRISGVTKELRPVFHEELNLLGFDKYWQYGSSEKPLLWAEMRRYYYKGELVAEANGGGLFKKPSLKVHKSPLRLEPVNVEEMAHRNRTKMAALIQNTVEMIYKKYNNYKNTVDVLYVAFSGGKDSIVLLDLVQKTLPHNEFVVIFGDTTMEISDTYDAVDNAKKRYPKINFYDAKSKYDAKDSWRIFGIPSRSLRWCCAVHKSAPSLIELRRILKKEKMRALALDGVRAAESDMRASYLREDNNSKHSSQINEHPLSNWNAAEIFLYILSNDLLYNRAYRYGSIRVGCILCPYASEWGEFITNTVYANDTRKFIDIIDESLKSKIEDNTERKKYIEYGGWKIRRDGRDLAPSGNRIIETEKDGVNSFSVLGNLDEFLEWLKPIGRAIEVGDGEYIITYRDTMHTFFVKEIDNGITVIIDKPRRTKNGMRFMYLFKNALYKTAYCEQCGVCMVECKYGALKYIDDKVYITEECCNCEKCLDMSKGCLIAKSKLYITGGKNIMIIGLGNYLHFGFDKTWLDYYFELEDNLWSSDRLGKPKYDALKLFLRESEITENNSLTEIGQELKRIKTNDVNCWAVILCNFAYNSSLIRWYLFNTSINTVYTQNEIIELLGDRYAYSTKKNAVTTLVRTFKSSPIGNELGTGICEIRGKTVVSITRTSWKSPDPLVILYSLYKFAERCDGHYSFTLSYLCDDTIEREGISPTRIFGLSQGDIKKTLISLSRDHSEFISIEFQKDLDNIDLCRNKTSLDVLKLL